MPEDIPPLAIERKWSEVSGHGTFDHTLAMQMSTYDRSRRHLSFVAIVAVGLTLAVRLERLPFRKTGETLMNNIEKRDSNETTETRIAPRPVRAGDKVARDEATRGEGKVYLGDSAPVFHN